MKDGQISLQAGQKILLVKEMIEGDQARIQVTPLMLSML